MPVTVQTVIAALVARTNMKDVAHPTTIILHSEPVATRVPVAAHAPIIAHVPAASHVPITAHAPAASSHVPRVPICVLEAPAPSTYMQYVQCSQLTKSTEFHVRSPVLVSKHQKCLYAITRGRQTGMYDDWY